MLPPELQAATSRSPLPPSSTGSIRSQKDAYERELLIEALQRNKWNQSATAKELGVDEKSVRYKMKKFAIQRPAT